VFDAAVAVEAGVAAFLAVADSAGEDDVLGLLESQGVEPWLAKRLVAFLPLAFGRIVLEDVQVAGTFVDGDSERRLDDDQVWLAARERAEWADGETIERIGLRSAEVNAVNGALHGGRRLEDLVLGPTVVPELPAVGDGDREAEGEGEAESSDGGLPSPTAAFALLLGGHGLAVDGDRAGELQFEARVFPHPRIDEVMAQVDFVIRHPRLAPEVLVESFAGWGPTWREALSLAVARFERASLHPIIAGLLDRAEGGDQVSWMPYEHPDGPFEVCLGGVQTMFAQEASTMPALWPVFDALKELSLSRRVHGLRLFLSYRDGVLDVNEVVLDNEPCPAGQEAAAAVESDVAAGYVTIRVFGLIVPKD
jgi:hypothetical protein